MSLDWRKLVRNPGRRKGLPDMAREAVVGLVAIGGGHRHRRHGMVLARLPLSACSDKPVAADQLGVKMTPWRPHFGSAAENDRRHGSARCCADGRPRASRDGRSKRWWWPAISP